MATLPSVPGIPTPLPVKDTEVAAILRPLKENVEIIRDYLVSNPIIQPTSVNPNTDTATNGGDGAPIYYINGFPVNDGYDPTTDYTPPPAPSGLSIQGAFTNILLEWNIVPSGFRNYAYTEVWRATTDSLGTASLLGLAPGAVYADPVGTRQKYYYWIRYVSLANVTGPYNAVTGTLGETALDPAYVLETLSNQITESELYGSLAQRINLIDADSGTPGSVSNRILQETIARQDAISALNSQITTISSVAGSNSSAIQVEATTRANVDGGLLAQYTVKVDVNGRVAGFGLASTSAGGTPISEFVVIADRFAVVSPAATGETPKVPFAIGTVDGITRVAMVNAFIQDAAISNAKIANLAVDSAKIANLAVTTAKIADANITTAKIADANITTAKIQDASINNAKIGYLAVGSANIQDAAITNAKIGNAAITNAKIGTAEITGAKIASATITNANIATATITTANIQDAAITNAKIGNAAVGTLSIQGNAVTVPATTSSAFNQEITYSELSFLSIYVTLQQPGWLYASVTALIDYPQGVVNGEHQLYINGTRVSRARSGLGPMTSMSMSGSLYLYSPGTYLINYTVYKNDEGGFGARFTQVGDRTMFAQGAMR